MRKYKDDKTGKTRKGLTLIHIGTGVWKIGKSGTIIKDGKTTGHQVIYAPDDKEYHLYGRETWKMEGYMETSDPGRSKIYILTHILDDQNNWCFDLKQKPETGKEVKVIYHNGTIKNITFSGEFEEIEIKNNWWHNGKIVMPLLIKKVIVPIAYRLK